MARWRDYRAERRERDSFVLLQHVYTLADGDPVVPVSGQRAAEHLCFRQDEAAELIDHLVHLGYLRQLSEVGLIAISPEGIDYIERLAWRRHSARDG